MSTSSSEEIQKLSVKELRKRLNELKVNFSDCIEKSELVTRLQQTLNKANGTTPLPTSVAVSAGGNSTAEGVHASAPPATTAESESVSISHSASDLPASCLPPVKLGKVVHIPRLHHEDPRAIELIKSMQPVILLGTKLVDYISERWNLDYLKKHVPAEAKFDVKCNNHWQFLYKDEKKGPLYQPDERSTTIEDLRVNFAHFVKMFRGSGAENRYVYMQHALQDNLGAHIRSDFSRCNFQYVNGMKEKFSEWGEFTNNVLYIGQRGVVTPLHYDEQHNLFCELSGRKRFILFSPAQWSCFYCYPCGHPSDRQSMVNLYSPDLERQPKFAEAIGHEAVLQPNEVLYIPPQWFHHVESPYEDTISMSWWFKHDQSTSELHAKIMAGGTIEPDVLVSVRRNVEKLVQNSIGAENYRKLFEAVDGGGEFTPELLQHRKAVEQLLSHLFPDPGPFLKELCAGRFCCLKDKVK